MLGMSVSGKTAIGQVASGVRLIHDEKKVKRMLEAQKREINPDASEELYYFLNAENHSPASSVQSTKRWVRGMLMSVGVESSH